MKKNKNMWKSGQCYGASKCTLGLSNGLDNENKKPMTIFKNIKNEEEKGEIKMKKILNLENAFVVSRMENVLNQMKGFRACSSSSNDSKLLIEFENKYYTVEVNEVPNINNLFTGVQTYL